MDEGGVEKRITALLARRHGPGWGDEPWDRRSEYLEGLGSVGGALLYSALFMPELIEVEGCVFLKDHTYVRRGWDEVAAGGQGGTSRVAGATEVVRGQLQLG